MAHPSTDPPSPGTHTRLDPFGLLVEAYAHGADLRQIQPHTLARWADEAKVVVLRGFPLLTKTELIEYCESWGEILRWDFGEVLDLQLAEDPQNYLFTRGPVPFHWDGAFTKTAPRYFLFQCVEAPAGGGGETVFCDTRLVYQAASPEQRQKWQDVNITYATDTRAHYGGKVTWPLVSRHPQTSEKVLRYAEPLPPEKFLNPLFLELDGVAADAYEEFTSELRQIIHQPAFCYTHHWHPGDIVIAENHSLIHGRNAFQGDSSRWLQRIQII